MASDVYKKQEDETDTDYKTRLQDELWAKASKKEFATRLDKLASEGKLTLAAKRIYEALKDFYRYVVNSFKGGEDLSKLSLSELIDRTNKELSGGKWLKELEKSKSTDGQIRTMTINGKQVKVRTIAADVMDGFYSPIENAVHALKQAKGTGEQMLQMIKQGKGVKADELQWTGVEEWLKSKGNERVTKQEILDYMKDNRVQLVEVVNSRDLSDPNQMMIPKEVVSALREMDNLGFDSVGEALSEIRRSPDTWKKDWDAEQSEDAGRVKIIEDYIKIKPTKYSQYQLSGERENYREVLVTLPVKTKIEKNGDKERLELLRRKRDDLLNRGESIRDVDSQIQLLSHRIDENIDYRSSHFDEPNIVGHLRMSDRVDADGNKVLHLEEMQSDWGQEGKKEGFVEKIDRNNIQNVREDENVWVVKFDDGSFLDISKKDAKNKEEAKTLALQSKKDRFQSRDAKIPSAPFVTNTSAWTKLLAKYAIKEAVKSGADKITWTSGETQNDRYDLSKQASKIAYNKETKTLGVWRKDNGGLDTMKVEPDKLADYVGKDLADRIHSDNGNYREYEGDNLQVGGKGMKGFYGSPTQTVELKTLPLLNEKGEINGEEFTKQADRILNGTARINTLLLGEEKGRTRGGRTAVEASLLIGAGESTSRKGQEGELRSEVIARQEKLLSDYADKNDKCVDENTVAKEASVQLPSGFESHVYRSADGKTVTKFVNYRTLDNTPQSYLDNRVALNNFLSPDSPYILKGFSKNPETGQFQFVVEQPYIQGENVDFNDAVQKKAFDAEMQKMGFRELATGVYIGKDHVLYDVKNGNVKITPEGNYRFIDVVTKLNDKKTGGTRQYGKGDAIQTEGHTGIVGKAFQEAVKDITGEKNVRIGETKIEVGTKRSDTGDFHDWVIGNHPEQDFSFDDAERQFGSQTSELYQEYKKKVGETTTTQHSIDITPEIRQGVSEGIPMFNIVDKSRDAREGETNKGKSAGSNNAPSQLLTGRAKRFIDKQFKKIENRVSYKTTQAEWDRFVKEHKEKTGNDISKFAGYTFYNKEGSITIAINPKRHKSEAEGETTMYHEKVHAFTILAINRPTTKAEREFRQKLLSIAKEYRVLNIDDDGYRASNLDEFLAHAITDRDFRNVLANIKSRKDAKERTLWQRLVTAIRDLLYNKVGYNGTMLKEVENLFTNFVDNNRYKDNLTYDGREHLGNAINHLDYKNAPQHVKDLLDERATNYYNADGTVNTKLFSNRYRRGAIGGVQGHNELSAGAKAQDYYEANPDRLPLTLSVFERPAFKAFRGKEIRPNELQGLLNQAGVKSIERDLIKSVVVANYPNAKSIPYNELETVVRANIIPLERIESTSYADYGSDAIQGNFDNTYTLILNFPEIEHGKTGHFNYQFTPKNARKKDYVVKQLDDKTWVAVEDNYQNNGANENTIMNFVGTATNSEAKAQEWIDNYEKRFTEGKEDVNTGMYGHIRVWENGNDVHIAELQSDFFQKEPARKTIIEKKIADSPELKKEQDRVSNLFEKSILSFLENSKDYEIGKSKISLNRSGAYVYFKGEEFFGVKEIKELVNQNSGLIPNRVKDNHTELLEAIDKAKKEQAKEQAKLEDKIVSTFTPAEKQFIASAKVWERRLLHEAIAEAKEKGADRVLFPTPHTLATIEGYIDGAAAPYEVTSTDNSYGNGNLGVGDTIEIYGDDFIVIDSDPYSDQMQVASRPDITTTLEDFISNEADYVYEDLGYLYDKDGSIELTESDLEITSGYKSVDDYLKEKLEELKDEERQELEEQGLSEEEIEESIKDATIDYTDYESDLKELIADEKREEIEYDVKDYFEKQMGYGKVALAENGDLYLWYKEPHIEYLTQPGENSANKEDFDISDLNKTQQRVIEKYVEYEKQLREDFGDDVSEVEDDNGFGWVALDLTEEASQKPIVAFQLTPDTKPFETGDKTPATKDNLQEKFKDAEVVQSESDLPQAIQDAAKEQGQTGKVKGVYHNGKVYIVADNIKTLGEAEGTYRHEALGHRGVIEHLGAKLDSYAVSVVDNAKGAKLGRLKKIAARYGLPTDFSKLTAEQKSKLGQEYIAHVSENKSKLPQAWNELATFVRKALRAIGIKLQVSDTEIQALIGKVEKRVSEVRANTEYSKNTLFLTDSDLDANGNPKPEILEEIQRELAQIEREAKANGTYHKAPNGKQSNLSEEQWVTVRTKRFKKWFGDWKTANKLQQIENAASIQIGNKIYSKDRTKEIYHSLKQPTNKYDNQSVKLVNSVFGKILRHKGFDSSKIIPHLTEIIENAIPIYFETERNPNVNNNIVGFHNYLSKISIDGKEYYVRVTAQELVEGRKGKTDNEIHSTFISDIEFYEVKDLTGSSVSSQIILQGDQTQTTKVDAKLQQFFEKARNAKEDSSVAIDKNGEPKVYYHGSETGGFTVFDTKSTGRRSNAKGIHFTDDTTVASTYSGKRYGIYGGEDINYKTAGYDIEYSENHEYSIYDEDGYLIEDNIETKEEAEQIANEHVRENYSRPENYAVFLNVKPPVIDIDYDGNGWSDVVYYSESENKYYFKDEYNGFKENEIPDDLEIAYYDINDVADQAKNMGDMGAVVRNVYDDGSKMGSNFVAGTSNQIIVFSPNQIKSATSNVGTFSNESNDTRFSVKEQTSADVLEVEKIINDVLKEEPETESKSIAEKKYTKNNTR